MKLKIKLSPRGQKILVRVILGLGFLCLVVALYFSPFFQNNRYVKAYRTEQQAKKYPAGSNDYARLMAIAEAIRRGNKDYTYTPNFNPMNPGTKP